MYCFARSHRGHLSQNTANQINNRPKRLKNNNSNKVKSSLIQRCDWYILPLYINHLCFCGCVIHLMQVSNNELDALLASAKVANYNINLNFNAIFNARYSQYVVILVHNFVITFSTFNCTHVFSPHIIVNSLPLSNSHCSVTSTQPLTAKLFMLLANSHLLNSVGYLHLNFGS